MENNRTNRNIVLVGGGGHCKSVLDSLLRTKEYANVVITDPDVIVGTKVLGCPVVGDDKELERLKIDGFEYAFVTVGSIIDASLRKKLVEKIERLGFKIPIIIDPTAIVSENAKIGVGTFIGKNVVINADVEICEYCIINTGSIIEHECFVGDFSHISVGAILCGNVQIGCKSFVGAGTTVIQGVKIGNNTIIGANSTVLADVGDETRAYGIIRQLIRE